MYDMRRRIGWFKYHHGEYPLYLSQYLYLHLHELIFSAFFIGAISLQCVAWTAEWHALFSTLSQGHRFVFRRFIFFWCNLPYSPMQLSGPVCRLPSIARRQSSIVTHCHPLSITVNHCQSPIVQRQLPIAILSFSV